MRSGEARWPSPFSIPTDAEPAAIAGCAAVAQASEVRRSARQSRQGLCQKLDKRSKSLKALSPYRALHIHQLGQPLSLTPDRVCSVSPSPQTEPTAGRCGAVPAVSFKDVGQIHIVTPSPRAVRLGTRAAVGIFSPPSAACRYACYAPILAAGAQRGSQHEVQGAPENAALNGGRSSFDVAMATGFSMVADVLRHARAYRPEAAFRGFAQSERVEPALGTAPRLPTNRHN